MENEASQIMPCFRSLTDWVDEIVVLHQSIILPVSLGSLLSAAGNTPQDSVQRLPSYERMGRPPKKASRESQRVALNYHQPPSLQHEQHSSSDEDDDDFFVLLEDYEVINEEDGADC